MQASFIVSCEYQDFEYVSRSAHRVAQAYAGDSPKPIGVIVSKQSIHREKINRGYIAMLSVNKSYRKLGIGTLSRSLASVRGTVGSLRLCISSSDRTMSISVGRTATYSIQHRERALFNQQAPLCVIQSK